MAVTVAVENGRLKLSNPTLASIWVPTTNLVCSEPWNGMAIERDKRHAQDARQATVIGTAEFTAMSLY